MSLFDLPDETLVDILTLLEASDVLRFAQVNRRVYHLIDTHSQRLRQLGSFAVCIFFYHSGCARDKYICFNYSDSTSFLRKISTCFRHKDHAEDKIINLGTFAYHKNSTVNLRGKRVKSFCLLNPNMVWKDVLTELERLYRLIFRHFVAVSVELTIHPESLLSISMTPTINDVNVDVPEHVFSRGFFMSERIHRLEYFEAAGDASVFDDDLLLQQKWLDGSVSRTGITASGMNRFIREWAEGNRKVLRFYVIFLKSSYVFQEDILNDLPDDLLPDDGWKNGILERADGAKLHFVPGYFQYGLLETTEPHVPLRAFSLDSDLRKRPLC